MTGYGWKLREAGLGGVRGLGRLRKSRGFSGAWKQEPGRNTGDPGRHTGNSGAGRELESPGRNEEEAQELGGCKQTTKINR